MTDFTEKQEREIALAAHALSLEERASLATLSSDERALQHAIHAECWRAMKDSIEKHGAQSVTLEACVDLEQYVRAGLERMMALARDAQGRG